MDGNAAGGAALLDRIFVSMGTHWPRLPFLSLGLYSSWILLCTASGSLFQFAGADSAGYMQGVFYVSSGVGVTCTLILCGVFERRIAPLVERGGLCLAGAVAASFATLAVALGIETLQAWQTVSLAALTGIGTAFLCLRVGHVTSVLNGPQGFFTILSAGLVANLVFFMCRGIPGPLAIAATSLLPFLAALVTFSKDANLTYTGDKNDQIALDSLPRGYFGRMIVAIFSFGLSVGIAKGLSALSQDTALYGSQVTLEVFYSFVLVAFVLVVVIVAKSIRNFDISRVYIPVVLGASIVILLTPVMGSGFFGTRNLLVSVLYNLFVLIIWCLLVDLSGRTTLSSTRVFGFGRGASALATTIGWAIPMTSETFGFDAAGSYSVLFCIVGVGIVVVAVFGFNERCISDALKKTMIRELNSGNDSGADLRDDRNWNRFLEEKARGKGLTARETEVFCLLATGRSVVYIAEELGISYNTAKGYTKNIYSKLELHTRQDLIDWVESDRI